MAKRILAETACRIRIFELTQVSTYSKSNSKTKMATEAEEPDDWKEGGYYV